MDFLGVSVLAVVLQSKNLVFSETTLQITHFCSSRRQQELLSNLQSLTFSDFIKVAVG